MLMLCLHSAICHIHINNNFILTTQIRWLRPCLQSLPALLPYHQKVDLLIINPLHRCECYGSYSVCVCICVSIVTSLVATYLVCKSKVRCYNISFLTVANICQYTVWISLKTLCLSLQFWHHLLTTARLPLFDEFSMDCMNNRDSDDYFSRRLVCTCSNISYN